MNDLKYHNQALKKVAVIKTVFNSRGKT